MAFTFRLEQEDGTPADPPTLHAAVPNWKAGDRISLGRGKALVVVGLRSGSDPDENPVLVVRST